MSLFDSSSNCWTVARADRFALLIDAEEYYSALRHSLLHAEKSIFIVGWDIDSRIRLAGEDDPNDDAPITLRDFLIHLVQEKPELTINVLLWDFSVLYALEREPIPILNLSWSTPSQIDVCLDDVVPLGASHHQKIVIIDGKVAYSGGLDLAMYRWDTREHRADHPLRSDPAGKSYKPFHDVQCVMDGEAAERLTDIVTERWEAAACKTPNVPVVDSDPWPAGVDSIFSNHEIAISRTQPPMLDRPGVFEVEQLFIDMIGQAEQSIYLENQFFTTDRVAAALADALEEKPNLEVILVSSMIPHGFLETHSMATGRERFMAHFEAKEVLDRVRLVYPCVDNGTDAGQDVLVHAKLSIVDDRFVRVGSANLNNRSMGTDGETDVTIEASNEEDREKITRIRNDFLGEHLGLSVDDVETELDKYGSLRATIDARQDEPRALKLTPYKADAIETIANFLEPIADPERPGDASQFVGNMLSARPGGLAIRGRTIVMGGLAVIAALAILWQVSPLAELTDPDVLREQMIELRGDPWAYVIIPLVFVLGSMLMFPITAMIGATAIVFPPTSAFIIAMIGSLIGAVANYALGAMLGQKFLRRLMGKRVNKVSRALGRRGVVTVATLRVVPVAPFTIINLVAGASHIKLSSFIIGSVVGLVPGIATLTLVGDQLFELISNPTAERTIWVAAALALWISVAFGLQFLIGKIRRRKQEA